MKRNILIKSKRITINLLLFLSFDYVSSKYNVYFIIDIRRITRYSYIQHEFALTRSENWGNPRTRRQ